MPLASDQGGQQQHSSHTQQQQLTGQQQGGKVSQTPLPVTANPPTGLPATSQQPGQQQQQPHVQLGTMGSLLCASGAGFVASTLTFPLDVVRKRVQVMYESYRSCIGHVW